jgi:hypothetical protein
MLAEPLRSSNAGFSVLPLQSQVSKTGLAASVAYQPTSPFYCDKRLAVEIAVCHPSPIV